MLPTSIRAVQGACSSWCKDLPWVKNVHGFHPWMKEWAGHQMKSTVSFTNSESNCLDAFLKHGKQYWGKGKVGKFCLHQHFELVMPISNEVLTTGFVDHMYTKKCAMMKWVHDVCDRLFGCHIGQRVRGSKGGKEPFVIKRFPYGKHTVLMLKALTPEDGLLASGISLLASTAPTTMLNDHNAEDIELLIQQIECLSSMMFVGTICEHNSLHSWVVHSH